MHRGQSYPLQVPSRVLAACIGESRLRLLTQGLGFVFGQREQIHNWQDGEMKSPGGSACRRERQGLD